MVLGTGWRKSHFTERKLIINVIYDEEKPVDFKKMY